ncbi:hypothetical protein [Paenimyroides aestuarii]|uniref:Uncharacterized protein n=1 Tax=Paenimyroides aestuarii TaxID=2968490 RepID=A0ABY5NUP3_9FLAO|nr:hypothetical protein [Paenimyroides aestuarii]UUV22315.1 hypothetical protein NPX36_04570 [Paenimyroides aestuarii]
MKKYILYLVICFVSSLNVHAQIETLEEAFKAESKQNQEYLRKSLHGEKSFLYVSKQGEIETILNGKEPIDVMELEDVIAIQKLRLTNEQLQQLKVLIINVPAESSNEIDLEVASLANLEYINLKGYDEQSLKKVSEKLSNQLKESRLKSKILIQKLNIDR